MSGTSLRPVLLAAAIAVSALIVSGCDRSGAADADPARPLRVAASIKPLGNLVAEVLADVDPEMWTLSVLMDGNSTPHGYEPAPSDVRALASGDVVVCNGLGLDGWAVRGARGSRTGQILVIFADAVGIKGDHEHDYFHCDHPDHDHHHHHREDEHFWLDPELVRQFTEEIGHALIRSAADRVYADAFAAQVEAGVQRTLASIEEVDRRFAAELEAYQGAGVITFHNVLSRPASRYGFEVAAVLRPIESLEPTAADIRRASEAISRRGIRAVFIEPQFSPTAARRIAERTGVQLVTLDPLGRNHDHWSPFMHEVLDVLLDGLAGGASR